MQTDANLAVTLLGDGRVETRPAPMPEVGPRQALVRMQASVVSTGTETTMIRGLRSVPQAAREPLRLGYTGAGVVERVGAEYDGPPPGTPVACYGAPYVSHSAWCAVSPNLMAPSRVAPSEAAFGGLGAVAMHAMRLAGVTLGERVGVLGLGVLGQIVAQLTRAAGAWVVASDPLAARRTLALSHGADVATAPDEFLPAVNAYTGGEGLDAVLVVAGTPDSAGPAQQALEALRFRGRLTIVGNVRTEWARETLFQKEATVQVSRAAGPGRYDASYERDGRDFPAGIVPWTEGRNLRSFTDLVAGGRVSVSPLITDTLPVEDAREAYARLMDAPNETMAFVLQYPGATP